jgi:hypothetical protein
VFAIPPAAVSLDDVVLILRERLRLYGDLQVYVIAEICGDERDQRLGVVRDHPEVTVELLCDQEDGDGDVPLAGSPDHGARPVRVAGAAPAGVTPLRWCSSSTTC